MLSVQAKRDYSYFAMAALRATFENSPYRIPFWLHANRCLSAALAMRNSKLREPAAYIAVRQNHWSVVHGYQSLTVTLQWIMIELAAIMSSEPTLWRRANIARGFMETVDYKNLWCPLNQAASPPSPLVPPRNPSFVCGASCTRSRERSPRRDRLCLLD